MDAKEKILHKHIDKESMDELSVNVWPDMLDAMQEHASHQSQISDEEIDNAACRLHPAPEESLTGGASFKDGQRSGFRKGAKWHRDQSHTNKSESLIDFFLWFRKNGEKYFEKSIEQLVEIYIKHTNSQ